MRQYDMEKHCLDLQDEEEIVQGDFCPYCGAAVQYWGKWDHELHLWQCPKCHKLMDQQELIESMPFEALDYYKQCRDSEIKD